MDLRTDLTPLWFPFQSFTTFTTEGFLFSFTATCACCFPSFLLCTMEKSPLAQALKPTYLASENKVYTSLSLPFFKLNKLSSLCLFSYILCCVTQYSRYHFTSAKQRRIMIMFNVLAVPLLMQPSMGLAFKY